MVWAKNAKFIVVWYSPAFSKRGEKVSPEDILFQIAAPRGYREGI